MCGELASHKRSQKAAVLKAGHPGVPSYIMFCLSVLCLGGLLYLSFLSYFFKLVCYAHVFPCTCM